jgi:hypothetical protein
MAIDKNSTILKVSIVHPDYGLYEGDIMFDLKVDRSNISEEMENQPQLYAWWASLTELTRLQYNKAKMALDVYEAELDRKFREEAAGGKITEAQMNAMIKRDPEWQKKTTDVYELKYKVGVLEAATWSFAQRADMIKALAPGLSYEGNRVELRDKKVVATDQQFSSPPVRQPIRQPVKQ